MSEYTTKPVPELQVYEGPINTTTDQILVVHNNSETVRVPVSVFALDRTVQSVPSSVSSGGNPGDISITADAVYTYIDGQWGITPRSLDWGVQYLRIDDNAPTPTEEQSGKLLSWINIPEAGVVSEHGEMASAKSGTVVLADSADLQYDDGRAYAVTPKYVKQYIADNMTGGSGSGSTHDFGLTSVYMANDETSAISGKGVSSALSLFASDTITSSYDKNNKSQAITGAGVYRAVEPLIPTSEYNGANVTTPVTGAAVAQAAAILREELKEEFADGVTVIANTEYDPVSEDAISGIGVSKALATLNIPNVVSVYNPTDTVSAISGKGVAEAIAGIGSTVTVTNDYDPTNTTDAVTGYAVDQAITGSVEDIAAVIADYLPHAKYDTYGIVKLGEQDVVGGTAVRTIGLNADGYLAVDTHAKSAYEIAVEEGFEGSEEEWLASLVGAPGKSAYEIAVANGFEGTEEEWLATIPYTEQLNSIVHEKVEEDINEVTMTAFDITAEATLNKNIQYAMLAAESLEPGITRKISIQFSSAAPEASALSGATEVYLGVWSGRINRYSGNPWMVEDNSGYQTSWTRMAVSKNAVRIPDGSEEYPYGGEGVWEFDNLVIPDAVDIAIAFLTAADVMSEDRSLPASSTTGIIVPVAVRDESNQTTYAKPGWICQLLSSGVSGFKASPVIKFSYFEFAPRLHVSNETKHLTETEHHDLTDLLYTPDQRTNNLLLSSEVRTATYNFIYAKISPERLTKGGVIKSVSIRLNNGGAQRKAGWNVRLVVGKATRESNWSAGSLIDKANVAPLGISSNFVTIPDYGSGQELTWEFSVDANQTVWKSDPDKPALYLAFVVYAEDNPDSSITSDVYAANTKYGNPLCNLGAMYAWDGDGNMGICAPVHAHTTVCPDAIITFDSLYTPISHMSDEVRHLTASEHTNLNALLYYQSEIVSLATRAAEILALLPPSTSEGESTTTTE